MLPPLPLSHADLERYRVRARQQRRAGLSGGHQTRRKGQSLEFRDFRDYLPGDDVRHIDWRASMRLGPGGRKLVREFVAEERLNLVISIDVRESMWLPDALSKLKMALWLAEALAVIALRGDDSVVLHPLFGTGACQQLRGRTAIGNVRPALLRLAGDGPCIPGNNLSALVPLLPPTAVWLVISDFYFQEQGPGRSLAAAIRSAREGFCWVLNLDLDSWPLERMQLGQGARRIEGPEVHGGDRPVVDLDDAALDRIETDIQAFKDRFRQDCGFSVHDLLHWPWPVVLPEEERGGEAFFRACFQQDLRLQKLFMRSAF